MSTTLAPSTPAETVLQRTAVRFIAGMPGLEEYRAFTLVPVDGGPVYWLECDEEPAIALPVAEAFAVAPQYAFDLYTSDSRALGITEPADALVLVVLAVPPGRGTITANLFAPIVVNRSAGRAKQIILDGSKHSLRHPVGER